MKLRFWSDAVNQLYAKDADKRLPDHPVVHEVNNVIRAAWCISQAFGFDSCAGEFFFHLNRHQFCYLFPQSQAIAQFRLPKMYLQRLIQSRQRASNAVFSTTEELEQHVEQSTSSVYYLLLRIAGVDDLNADHAASHLGKAQGISNLLRTLATMSNQASGTSRMAMPPIPQDILLKYSCSYERILRQQVDDLDTQNCVYDVASVASVHLTKARKLSDKLNANARIVLLPAVAIERFLDRLRLCHFHLYDRRLARSDGLLPLVYFWNRWRGRF